jgi:WD40 repeat protein
MILLDTDSSWDGTVGLWEARTGQGLGYCKGHTSVVGTARFSSDGARLATASWDRTARVWDVATRQELLVRFFPPGPGRKRLQ